jgi:hypothetical protein
LRACCGLTVRPSVVGCDQPGYPCITGAGAGTPSWGMLRACPGRILIRTKNLQAPSPGATPTARCTPRCGGALRTRYGEHQTDSYACLQPLEGRQSTCHPRERVDCWPACFDGCASPHIPPAHADGKQTAARVPVATGVGAKSPRSRRVSCQLALAFMRGTKRHSAGKIKRNNAQAQLTRKDVSWTD